ncbi:type II secretory pathway pseudopilin PulG [Sphingomonas zeicaulis]|uniref:glycine zipper 2TM domain-containing protein n=1 Tax=Sphingomonas zeicaulis TaxID=1632740 RepID=UPI003D201029
MKTFIVAALLAAIAAPVAPALAGPQDAREYRRDVRKADREYQRDVREARRDRNNARRDAWRDYNRYDYNRPDPRTGRYDAGRYYRDGRYYKARTMRRGERVYRGNDGRYYCRRNDGTTGLIIGGIGGGVLGNVIAPGDSKTIGTVLGAGLGALLGREVDRGEVRCR